MSPDGPPGGGATLEEVRRAVGEHADRFAARRGERQRRRGLDPDDFAMLARAGLPLLAVPRACGGLWRDVGSSTRPVADLLRALARADASVALVAAMHPSVLALWLATPAVPEPHAGTWTAQRDAVFATAAGGAWWGTITSEPGSGGDISRTRAAARRDPGSRGDQDADPLRPVWRLSGAKHFGSGTGVTAFMLTTAVPEGEDEPDVFFVDMRGVPLDGSRGVELIAEWDGHGMVATQSHGLAFDDFPATRVAWPGHWRDLTNAATGVIAPAFAAVTVGIVDVAVAAAGDRLAGRDLRPYDRVEWTRAQTDAWVLRQAFEGMLRAVEQVADPRRDLLTGKLAVAETAEAALARICRVLGGGTYSRASPFGQWFEDVRALGFLRPPWGLAYEAVADLETDERP